MTNSTNKFPINLEGLTGNLLGILICKFDCLLFENFIVNLIECDTTIKKLN